MTRSCARSAMPLVSAAYWGMHMVWGLHSPLRFVAAIATDFSLGRVWKRDVGANTCRALKAGCADPSQCSSADVLRRPWQDIATVTAKAAEAGGICFWRRADLPCMRRRLLHVPRRVKNVPGRADHLGAYGHYTHEGRGLSAHLSATANRYAKHFASHLQSAAALILWIAPSSAAAPDPTLDRPSSLQFGLSPYSPQCAGAMLAVWTTIWKHSPVVPNTVSFDL